MSKIQLNYETTSRHPVCTLCACTSKKYWKCYYCEQLHENTYVLCDDCYKKNKEHVCFSHSMYITKNT